MGSTLHIVLGHFHRRPYNQENSVSYFHRKRMNCRNAFNPSSKWENYLAFLELRKSPNFFVSPNDSVKKPNVMSTSTTTDNTVSDLSDHEGKYSSDGDKVE
jgi:hypothetical protein